MSLAVVIPSRTRSNLDACAAAVREHEPGAELIVIDDGLEGWSDRLDVLRIAGRKPFIFARNCNLGIKAALNDVVLLNDDAILKTPGGFSALQQAAAEHPEYGIISSTTNLAGNPQQRPQGRGLRPATETVAFVCVLIPAHTIEAVGLLDERFTAYGWEDNDYCRRVREAGLKVGIHDGCYVDHGSLKSTFRGHPGAAGDISAGARIYREKWGDLR